MKNFELYADRVAAMIGVIRSVDNKCVECPARNEGGVCGGYGSCAMAFKKWALAPALDIVDSIRAYLRWRSGERACEKAASRTANFERHIAAVARFIDSLPPESKCANCVVNNTGGSCACPEACAPSFMQWADSEQFSPIEYILSLDDDGGPNGA